MVKDSAQPEQEQQFPEVRQKAGIQPDDALAEAARKILQFHFARMLHHEPGTRLGEDVEELHDMRVSIRRMRAAFRTFGRAFKPKVAKTWARELRATGRTLGRVRDLDVLAEKAGHYLATLSKEARQGLDPLFAFWGQEREQARIRMLAYLDGERYRTFKQGFNVFLNSAEAGVRSYSGKQARLDRVRYAAPLLIYDRLAVVRTYESTLDEISIEQLHRLRIDFKRLRYTIEFFREVLGREVKGVINDLKQMQDHLGDLNDADVACQFLGEFLEAWDERQPGLPAAEPVASYLAARLDERQRLLMTFNEAWTRFNRPDFRRNLALAIARL